MNTPRVFRVTGVLIALFALPLTALAETWIKPGEERLVVSAGAFLPEFDTEMRIDSRTLGTGIKIDLEDDLLLNEDIETGYLDITWRPFNRHRLSLAAFRFNRDASGVATANIEFNPGDIIQVGAFIGTELELDVYPFGYGYSLIKNDSHELTGTLGLHWTDLSFSVTASAWVADADASGSLKAKASGPLPLLGVDYRYNISDRATVGAGAQYFGIKLNDDLTTFEGSLYNLRVSAEYWPWNQVGIGAALNAFGLDVDVDDDEWIGTLDYDYWGPQIYLKGRF